MEARLSLITLGVRDVTRARAFYEALGFRASGASQAEVAFFQAGALALAVWDRAALAADAGLSEAGSGFSGVAIAHNVREKHEVEAVLAEAERAGGRITRAAEDAAWGGRTGYFADPDGHVWEVAWNPHFEIAADGALKLPE
ncbi:MAG: VOC family protein [Hyphomonadaceae bacterium]|nr:VOC family protein [Hyphomonadaceae bacterium]